MSIKDEITDYVIRNSGYFVIIVIIYIFTTLFVVAKPKGFAIPEISTTYDLFGTSLTGFILLLLISGYLLSSYFSGARPLEKAPFQLIWGASFLIYSITLLGLLLQAWGFEFADMTDPIFFLIWRTPMILWVAGMWIGVTELHTDSPKITYLAALVIFLLGESWFFIGLILLRDIELTMYGFLYWEFVPMAFILALLWYNYGKSANLHSPRVISAGFTLFGIAYLAWAPWHFDELKYVWFIWFNLYLVSLAILLTGFYALPKEILGQFHEELEEE
ncbi:MAG: hypothetical protein JSV04_10140 [Candidatus Heimdallarchaeota archaeon]|nr:MAG: hypothetical protein JSV04_10140 [Candidatus Heimdallarchaeota archaeon]